MAKKNSKIPENRSDSESNIGRGTKAVAFVLIAAMVVFAFLTAGIFFMN